MVDNRSAGFFGIGGAFNFKSGDISGTAANCQDDKMGPGTEYGVIEHGEDEDSQNQNQYVDRSAQLRATLNSLAMMNVANVLNEKKRLEKLVKEKSQTSHVDDEEFIDDFEEKYEKDSENEISFDEEKLFDELIEDDVED